MINNILFLQSREKWEKKCERITVSTGRGNYVYTARRQSMASRNSVNERLFSGHSDYIVIRSFSTVTHHPAVMARDIFFRCAYLKSKSKLNMNKIFTQKRNGGKKYHYKHVA